MSSTPIFCKVNDDTGGGHSLTQFGKLYFEGSSDEAALAIESSFDLTRDKSTPEYGSVFSFKESSDFAQLSGFDRGCLYNRETQQYEESPSGNSYYKYKTVDQLKSHDSLSAAEAVAHRFNYQFDAAYPDVYLDRASTLILCLGHYTSADYSEKGDAATAFLNLISDDAYLTHLSRNLGPHIGPLLAGFYECVDEARHCAEAFIHGDEEAPEGWILASKTLCALHFNRIYELLPMLHKESSAFTDRLSECLLSDFVKPDLSLWISQLSTDVLVDLKAKSPVDHLLSLQDHPTPDYLERVSLFIPLLEREILDRHTHSSSLLTAPLVPSLRL